MDEKKTNAQQTPETSEVFSDLLQDAPISSLNITEPEYAAFDAEAVLAQARAANSKEPRKVTGKRTARAASKKRTDSAVNFFETSKENRTKRAQPKTFVELLHTDFLEEEQPKEEPQAESALPASPIVESEEKQEEAAPQPDLKEAEMKRQEELFAGPESEIEEEEDHEEEVLDPGASLVDDYDYDEYEDRKRFLLSDYRKVEEYLRAQSAQGFHYTRHEGKKYYFYKGAPHNYYYKILYFTDEPKESDWEKLREQGWEHVNHTASRHKKDAGWYVVRSEPAQGELPKDIENEEEKARYFRKFAASCRSTMFLLFVVMFCCALSIVLQIEFKGFLAVIIASAILFVIALYTFLVYVRMQAKAKKQVSLLTARIRLKENDPQWQKIHHAAQTDAQLEKEWKNLDEKEAEK